MTTVSFLAGRELEQAAAQTLAVAGGIGQDTPETVLSQEPFNADKLLSPPTVALRQAKLEPSEIHPSAGLAASQPTIAEKQQQEAAIVSSAGETDQRPDFLENAAPNAMVTDPSNKLVEPQLANSGGPSVTAEPVPESMILSTNSNALQAAQQPPAATSEPYSSAAGTSSVSAEAIGSQAQHPNTLTNGLDTTPSLLSNGDVEVHAEAAQQKDDSQQMLGKQRGRPRKAAVDSERQAPARVSKRTKPSAPWR